MFDVDLDEVWVDAANFPSRYRAWLERDFSYPSSDAIRDDVALVMTDLVGSTNQLVAVGDKEWDRLLNLHFDRIRELIADLRGFEVDTSGDGVFCLFLAVEDALHFATELQKYPGNEALKVRVGIHFGMAMQRKLNLCGLAVHFTARVMSYGIGADIWLSDHAARELAESYGKGGVKRLDRYGDCVLKGFGDQRYTLWRVAAE